MKIVHDGCSLPMLEASDGKLYRLQIVKDGDWKTCDVIPPIDMVLHCPKCHVQHIDEPAVLGKIFACHHADPMTCSCDNRRWTNPPHRSHLCHACGFIWRPCDLPTNGVEKIATRGKNDS